MRGYAPRAREASVRPRLQSGARVRPLNFTVRAHVRGLSHLPASLPLLGGPFEKPVASFDQAFLRELKYPLSATP